MLKSVLTLLLILFILPTQAFAASFLGYQGKDYVKIGSGLYITGDAEIGSNDIFVNAIAKATGAKFTFDPGFALGGSFGFKFDSGYETELEYSYGKNDITGITSNFGSVSFPGEASRHSIMGNLAYNFMNSKNLSPYLGVGLGMALHHAETSLDGNKTTGSDTTFAYQLLTGVNYLMTPTAELGLGYRYWGSSDPEIGGITSEVRTHVVVVTLRHFWGKGSKGKRHRNKRK